MPKGRQKVTSDGGAKSLLYNRAAPTYRFRLSAVRHYQANGMASTLERFYPDLMGSLRDTKHKSIYLWVKRIAVIEAACSHQVTGDQKRLRKQGTATVLLRDTELDILKWINGYRADGAPISAAMLKRKGRQVAQEVGVSLSVFSASRSWCKAFLRRHALSFCSRTRQGQKTPVDHDAVLSKFNEDLRARMHDLQVDVVYNADQTPVLFEHIPKTTIDSKGVNTVWVRSGGKDKERITCMLLGDSFGRKYTPFLVLKTADSKKKDVAVENKDKRHGFGTRLWSQMTALQSEFDVQLFGNSTAWWNSDLSVQFLKYHFEDRPDKTMPVLLLWDDFSAHWTDRVLQCAERLNVVLMKVPPGYTSVCQPADLSWNRPLKERLRQRWAEQLHCQLDNHDKADGNFKLTPPSRNDVVKWVAESWESLSVSTIGNGFNAISAKEPVDTDVQRRYNYLASRLDELHLLDSEIGEVTLDHDVVEITLSCFE